MAYKNFAYSTVATAPAPANSGTSLIVQSGDGSIFPSAPFEATVWPSGVQPLVSNAEIVRITAKSGDTFTIIRAQEDSSAVSVLVGFQIAATITAKNIFSFETVSSNLINYPYDLNYTDGNITSIVYDLGNTLTITKTFNYTGTDITSIVLSGDTPDGIPLTKTLTYTSGDVTAVVYS